MGAYEFIVDLHRRGGCHIEYTEPNETQVKEIFIQGA